MQRLLCLLFGFVLLIPATLRDQPVAIVEGTVSNDLGTPLYGASVRIRNVMTGTFAETSSDRQGLYEIKDLLQGRYSLWATADGYGSIWIREIVLNAGDRVRQDIRFHRRLPTSSAVAMEMQSAPAMK